MESFEKQFADTLAIRGLSPRTQVVYVPMLREFARFVGKPLDTVVPEDLRTYQRHLAVERQVGFSHFNQATCALRLFFRECLGKTDWPFERIPFQRKRRILPEILSQEEVARIFDACSNLKHKTVLMTAYSGGLRLGETLALLPSDIDSGRMVIRVEQGKGRKDRYVMLSKTLLQTLREYWRAFRPLRWLFYGQTKQSPSPPRPPRRSSRSPRARPPSPRTSPSTRFVTPSPLTCSRTAPTFASSRPCWVTAA
jgi:integrase/recombinase XerD